MVSSPALERGQPLSSSAHPASQSPSVVKLLSTWRAWSYRERLTHKIAEACRVGNTDRVQTLTRGLDAVAVVGPLDALTANHELASLLLAAQGHAIRAARKAGLTWQQIATAIGTTAEQACADYLARIEHANWDTNTKVISISRSQQR